MDIYGVYFALMNYAEGSVQNVRASNSYLQSAPAYKKKKHEE